MIVVFFDIGETLAAPRLSLTGELVGFDVYPYVREVLAMLRARGARLGILSNTGDTGAPRMREVLEAAGIYDAFEPALLAYSAELGLKKDSPKIFEDAAKLAGVAPGECVFVGEDARERGFALAAGMRVAPHPRLAEAVLDGQKLHYARIGVGRTTAAAGDWRRALRDRPLVPLHVAGEDGRRVLVIAPSSELAAVDDLGFDVDRLGRSDAPDETDVYLLRDDVQVTSGFLAPRGSSATRFAARADAELVLASGREGLYVALPATRSIEEIHFEGALHGHTQKLLPDPMLLEPFGSTLDGTGVAAFIRTSIVEAKLGDRELERLAQLSPVSIQRHLDRYTGKMPLERSGESKPLSSRHVLHPDNQRAVQQLARDLTDIGGGAFEVRLHRFFHEGRLLFNVEAELRGGLSTSSELVLVTAHLDSTGAYSDGPYAPERDAAPGADDDASGVAAVLAIGELFAHVSKMRALSRRIRFVLFNAEEHGLVGSKAYARDAAAAKTPIVGVFQMDMIGYRSNDDRAPRPFEVHVGYAPSKDVEERSLVLANRITRVTEQVSPGLVRPQVYRDSDPAAGRSDHASFQERGYAACAISEDFFVGPHATSPEAQPNPNYHKPADEVVNLEYAADIARAVGAAALITAS